MSIDTDTLYMVQAACEQWTDNRVMHADDVVDLVLLVGYGTKVLSQNGKVFKGFQLRQKGDLWLLTVKVVEDGVPLVAFVSAPTAAGSVGTFIRHLEEDGVAWRRDKYPWT